MATAAAICTFTSTCAIPAKLTREQRKLIEQLRELLPAENEPAEKGIFDKVKDYFL